MPSLSSSNRSQLSYKLEGTYPTNFGVMQGGNGTLLGMTSETLDATYKQESSKEIRSDRQTPDIVQVSASSQGGFGFEHKYREYDPFIQGVLQQDFTAYGTAGVSASIATLTLASGTITAGVAPTGSDAFSGLQKGQWFSIIPPAGASDVVKLYLAGRPFRVSTVTAPTTTVITLDTATPIDTSKAGVAISAGFIATSRATNGNTMKSYTIEVQHADISVFRQYTGMVPSKMDLKLSVGSIVTGTFDFMGKGFVLATTTGMGGSPVASQTFTPANATKGVFDIFENGASIGVTTFIKSADFTIDNTLRAQEAIGVFGNAGIAAGTMKITGKLEVYFADTVIYAKLLNGAASSLSIPILDVDGNGYVYYFPRIKYTAAKVNAGGLDQDNMLSMDFQALPDITTGSPTLGVSVVIYRVGA
jgi:hypothetical protein